MYTYTQIRASDRVLASICWDAALSLETALGAEEEEAEAEAEARHGNLKVIVI
jgi:hypothetical protein